MKWKFYDDRPIYSQIIEQVKMFIVSGILKPGERFPSVREFASEAGVNPNTMQRALLELERDNLVYSNRTSGRFITEDEELINNIKKQLAKEKTEDFFAFMKNLGYDEKTAKNLILNYNGEDNING